MRQPIITLAAHALSHHFASGRTSNDARLWLGFSLLCLTLFAFPPSHVGQIADQYLKDVDEPLGYFTSAAHAILCGKLFSCRLFIFRFRKPNMWLWRSFFRILIFLRYCFFLIFWSRYVLLISSLGRGGDMIICILQYWFFVPVPIDPIDRLCRRWLQGYAEDEAEAVHLATLLLQHGYLFPVIEPAMTVRDDGTLYRLQRPYFWPSHATQTDNVEYGKRSPQAFFLQSMSWIR